MWSVVIKQKGSERGVFKDTIPIFTCTTKDNRQSLGHTNPFFDLLLLLFIHYLQLGRHPVAGVITCYISTDYEDFTLKFRYGGLHGKHVVATWNCREPSQHLL